MSNLIRPTDREFRDPLVNGEHASDEGKSETTREEAPSPSQRIIRLGEAKGQGQEESKEEVQGAGPTFGQAPAHLTHTLRRPDGWTLTTDRQTGETLDETDTLMCVHCQFTWQFRPGSGVERGYCYRCNGVLCGKHSCMISCNPFEAVIEMKEAEYRELRRRLGIPV